MEEIKNKVAESKLVVFDLEDYFPTSEMVSFDISQFLTEGFLLKETEFRDQLKNFDWSIFQNQFVGIFCSTDAILPAWAFTLVSVNLNQIASKVIQCNPEELLLNYYNYKLQTINYSVYSNLPIILKGCSKKAVPSQAYVTAIQHLQPFAKSIMFGEACSAVPLFKAKKAAI
jgi:DNA mismatch repair ATPase MutS